MPGIDFFQFQLTQVWLSENQTSLASDEQLQTNYLPLQQLSSSVKLQEPCDT